MLYTRKGDKGDTYFFGCNQRFMKSSALAEALGVLDEINSMLGFCKIRATKAWFKIGKKKVLLKDIVHQIQEDLFIIQAALAGAPKKITAEKIKYLEDIIDNIEKQLPPIKTFFISGGTELASLFDYTRAVARRGERRVVELSEKRKIALEILSYMNRLSSILYALARISNAVSGKKEKPPTYK